MALATIQKVNKLNNIEGAERVQLARILGWNVMVRKDSMSIDDKVVYFEIDSLLPDIPQLSFLKDKGFPYRLKTEKYFKGRVVSQGLALPATEFSLDNMELGSDVTDILGITKYEKQIDPILGGESAGSFPSYIPKTDEIRLQAIPEVLEEIEGQLVYISVKLDGTSATYLCGREDKSFIICSRNMQKKPDTNVYSVVAEFYKLSEVLKDVPYALQGEICGVGIQKNPLDIKGCEFYIFNIYDYSEHKYLPYYEMMAFIDKNNLKSVPIMDYGVFVKEWNIENLVELSKGKYEGTNNDREGIVIRSMTNEHSNLIGNRLSFKVVNPDYRD